MQFPLRHLAAVSVALVVLLALSASLVVARGSSKSLWYEARDAKPGDEVVVFLALHQRNLDLLSSIHEAIHDPSSPEYGRIYTTDQVLGLVAPPKEDLQSVLDWIHQTALASAPKEELQQKFEVVSYGDAVRIKTVLPSVVEDLFSTKLKLYKHPNTRMTVVRQEVFRGYSLPEHIQPLIEMVTGLSDYPHLQNKKKKSQVSDLEISSALRDKYAYIAPDTIRDLYSIPKDYKGGSNSDNIQVALEFWGEGIPVMSDWVQFTVEANETFQNYSKIINVDKKPDDDGEATLDVEYIAAIGSNISTWFWTIRHGWAYEMALDVFNQEAPHPTVISVSWGWPELDSCNSAVVHANCTGIDVQTYVNRTNVELQKTELLRISWLICSQDEGAPSEMNIDCSLDRTDHPVYAIFPCSSPYVTCVGATTVGPEEEGTKPPTSPPLCDGKYHCAESHHEVPCSVENTLFKWTSGGGFSEFSVRPSYQDDVVTAYLSNSSVAPPPDKFNNSKQRGYPDVVAVGARILTIEYGVIEVSAGTSASTPIFAGIVSLLNDYRLSQGKTPLGFLNPLLYQMAKAQPGTFQDVTEGNNRCTSGVCCKYGFEAGPGWDAVSGLGSPNYENMLEYVKALPN